MILILESGAGFKPVGFCPCKDQPPQAEACATKQKTSKEFQEGK
jgi:hypothetical protein